MSSPDLSVGALPIMPLSTNNNKSTSHLPTRTTSQEETLTALPPYPPQSQTPSIDTRFTRLYGHNADSLVLSSSFWPPPLDDCDDLDRRSLSSVSTLSRLPPAHLSSPRSSTGFGHAAQRSPTFADFPVIPSRPPLRPTASFGGLSRMSYYSSMSSELEKRSMAVADVEEREYSTSRRPKDRSCLTPLGALLQGRRK